MRILFYGDIVGELGRLALLHSLPKLKEQWHPDFVIANGENATHGKGLSLAHYKFIVGAGVDAVTLGNHWHSKTQIDSYIDETDKLIRPLNLINYHHGVGSRLFTKNGVNIRVTNLLAQAFMTETVASPVLTLSAFITEHKEPCIHIVDFHGDSTSEKAILAYYFDGKVGAVLGTHTHVQTADARILPNGTGFITDAGMTGEEGGIIGYTKDSVIQKMVFGEKGPFGLAIDGKAMANGVVMDFDNQTFKCISIHPFNLDLGELHE